MLLPIQFSFLDCRRQHSGTQDHHWCWYWVGGRRHGLALWLVYQSAGNTLLISDTRIWSVLPVWSDWLAKIWVLRPVLCEDTAVLKIGRLQDVLINIYFYFWYIMKRQLSYNLNIVTYKYYVKVSGHFQCRCTLSSSFSSSPPWPCRCPRPRVSGTSITCVGTSQARH